MYTRTRASDVQGLGAQATAVRSAPAAPASVVSCATRCAVMRDGTGAVPGEEYIQMQQY